jgi:hypothetical protein
MIKRIRAAFAAFFVAGTIVAAIPAAAVPLICVMPTSGTVSGLTLVNDINNCLGSALALFAGGTTPDSPTTGMLWWNTNTGYVAQWDGTGWNNLWNVDTTNHLNAVQIGGGVQASLASASITDLWSVPVASVTVSGTSTITQLANGHAVPGTLKIVTFAGALTLTQGGGSGGTPLNLPNNGGNIATATGDYAIVLALTATNVQVIQYTRATGAALSTAGLNVGASALGASALPSFGQPVNLQINTAVPGNQLTVSIVGVNGSNPSSTNPVLVGFRSQTGSPSGTNIIGSLQAALSFTLATTSSMGCTTAVTCRLWVTLICQTESAGACTSILVGLSNQSTSTQIFPLAEEKLQSTGPGTTGGTSAGTIQTSVASLSGVGVRIVGFIEATWTSGTGWASPNRVALFAPGMHKPGDVVQSVYASNATGAGTSSNSPTTFLSQAMTLSSAINLVRINAGAFGSTGAQQNSITIQMYRGTIALGVGQGIGCVAGGCTTAAVQAGVSFPLLDQPGSTSPTYNLKFLSGNNVNNVTISGATMVLEEIMGALEPGNDAGATDLPPRALAALQPDRARQRAVA